jgi:hypothetical protein
VILWLGAAFGVPGERHDGDGATNDEGEIGYRATFVIDTARIM